MQGRLRIYRYVWWREARRTERADCEAHSDELFLFGENDNDFGTTRRQKNTQAVIRGCANAHPVRTCYGSGNGYRTPACQAVAGPFEAVSGLGWEVCDG